MGRDSNIEWTDHTFNPWIGCTKVSPGCANCYAEALNVRWHKGVNWGKGNPRVRTSAEYWKQPVRWNKAAGRRPGALERTDRPEAGPTRRPRVFCASLADWLDDEVPIEWLADLLRLIHDTPNLDWLLLTKRPENWSERLHAVVSQTHDIDVEASAWLDGEAWLNVWVGVSIEDQQRMQRHAYLMAIPARVHFWSAEPLLSPLDCTGAWSTHGAPDWVICGGESGARKRPFDAEWARSLREQCAEANAAFFMKQMDKVIPIPADLMVREWPTARGQMRNS